MHNDADTLDKYKEYHKEVEDEQRLLEPNHEFMGFLQSIDKEKIEKNEEE